MLIGRICQKIASLFSKDALTKLKDNIEVELAIVSRNGIALQHASERVRNNRAVALAAVRQNDEALRFVSENLQNDRNYKRREGSVEPPL